MGIIKRYISAIREKKLVFILSTMRSGSTLLKSLLAVPDETSHLPEVHFHKMKIAQKFRLKALSDKPVIVLKKPSWIGEENYPTLPAFNNRKIIVLIRHPYETIQSILKMKKEIDPENKLLWTPSVILDYWNDTYEQLNLLDLDAMVVRYESLVENPIEVTHKLFEYLDINHPGIDRYQKPSTYQWSWMNDDGGEKIQSLKVQPSPIQRKDEDIIELIANNSITQSLLRDYGYDQ